MLTTTGSGRQGMCWVGLRVKPEANKNSRPCNDDLCTGMIDGKALGRPAACGFGDKGGVTRR
jgi:hypothetical protein